MSNFVFNSTKSILNELGSASRLAALCEEMGCQSALLITDRGLLDLGIPDAALASFANAAVSVAVFDGVEEDPADQIVLDAVEHAKQVGADIVIGFGGGSSMDVAKLVALLASDGCSQSLTDTYGVGNAQGQRLPLIQVPTTAGTGSEVTAVAIVTTGATTKTGVVSPLLLPDLALLDAELTLRLPPAVTAATGIDAMVHAIEAYTSVHKKNPVSDMLAKEALRLLAANIDTAVHDGGNLEARSNMLLGAMLAGQAFANAPVAAVHALAYPLGGHFHIPHGLSNALVLPQVLRFNAENDQAKRWYAELAPIVVQEPKLALAPGSEAVCRLVETVASFSPSLGLPTSLREMDIPEDFLPTLASDAMLQQRLLVNNPREVSEADALAIYQASY